MGYIIQVILNFLIDLFFEDEELTTPQPASPTESKEQPTDKPSLEQRAQLLKNELRQQRSVSWSEFKANNQTINSYLINSQGVP